MAQFIHTKTVVCSVYDKNLKIYEDESRFTALTPSPLDPKGQNLTCKNAQSKRKNKLNTSSYYTEN